VEALGEASPFCAPLSFFPLSLISSRAVAPFRVRAAVSALLSPN